MKTLKFLLFAVLALSMGMACSGNDMQGQEKLKDGIGYVVGYETCGLSLENKEAKGYIVISEDLKDTLAVYGLPGIFEFPEEVFPVIATSTGIVNTAFPEKFRYAFKMRFTYTLSSEEELHELGLRESCVILHAYLIQYTYKNCVPVIINSAINLETPMPETPPAIRGLWEVKMISISGKLANISSPPDNILFSNILIKIPADTPGQMEGHTFYNTIGIGFEIVGHQQIKIKSYGGTRIAEDKWGQTFSDHIRNVVKFDISNNELTFMDSQNNPLITLTKKD